MGRACAGGDLQLGGFGSLLLTCLAVTSPWELSTRVVGDSGAAKARDSRHDDHGKDGHPHYSTLACIQITLHVLIQA